jgi:hypothetical protein
MIIINCSDFFHRYFEEEVLAALTPVRIKKRKRSFSLNTEII